MWTSYKINERIRITEMFSFFEKEFEKGYEFRGESHNFWECLYVQRGTVCVSADERVYNLGQNGIVFHKPLEFHKFYVDSDEGARLCIFSFSCEGELCDYFRNKVFVLSEEQQATVVAMLAYCKSKTKEAENENRPESQSSFHPLKFINNDLQMLATYICQLFLSLADSGKRMKISDSFEVEVFRRAVDYMNINISSQPTVSAISRFCNISESGLKRIFNKFAGIGIHKYLLQIKIKAAIELIEQGASVSDTAERLGFSSQGYFSAMFKRETGRSPSDFK